MSLRAGIVGLPNVGKSTLFNAIAKKNAIAANYPFATIEPNIGVVIVPDQRLDFLNEMYEPDSLIPTTYEFIDIAGLVEGASKGDGLGNKFLSHIREVDAIVEVVRCFDNPDITHVCGYADPIRDIEIINVELVLSDLEIVQTRLEKIVKKAEATKDRDLLFEVETLKKVERILLNNKAIRNERFSHDEEKLIKSFNLLTSKPIIYAANISEDSMATGDNKLTLLVKDYASKEKAAVVVICAKVEEELSAFDEKEKKEYLKSIGISNSGLDKLIYATYDLLGLATFFTSGKDEVRAWTFIKGTKAPKCAGIIHSDFEKGFIKAEVMSFEDLKKYGNEAKVKEAGRLRLEGKEYLMQDGDICYFRFNV
ncbi:MAG: redox-regulated ATPase YchF [Mollicutes bacterium]|nr:redox-regulated ATPase YchF [Mollicutes bacterium]